MNFHRLNEIVEREKTYTTIANYIVENNIDIKSFFLEVFENINQKHNDEYLNEVCFLLSETGQSVGGVPGVSVTATQPAAPAAPSPQKSWWNRFTDKAAGFWRGMTGTQNPGDVVNLLKKASDLLGKEELKSQYQDELKAIAQLMSSVENKYKTQQAQQQNAQAAATTENPTAAESPAAGSSETK